MPRTRALAGCPTPMFSVLGLGALPTPRDGKRRFMDPASPWSESAFFRLSRIAGSFRFPTMVFASFGLRSELTPAARSAFRTLVSGSSPVIAPRAPPRAARPITKRTPALTLPSCPAPTRAEERRAERGDSTSLIPASTTAIRASLSDFDSPLIILPTAGRASTAASGAMPMSWETEIAASCAHALARGGALAARLRAWWMSAFSLRPKSGSL